MTTIEVLTVLAAVFTGGLGTEIYRSWRFRKKSDFELFYPTWKEEMNRLHGEIQELRIMVIGLSEEVARLGGDPLAVRTAAVDSSKATAMKGK
jgi:hypothetical protein